MGDIHGVDRPPRAVSLVRAAATALGLSLLFVALYGGTNWLTAQRAGAVVRAWHFDWELSAIPFVPALVIPYMSMDLFFFGAPFLCRSRRELRVFTQRVVFSILVATVCFVALPLKLGWPERPGVDGLYGQFVAQSFTAPFLMEYPHNLFPSLHIVLCMIVADTYARHTRGTLRLLLCSWFFLVGIATILTWQHHLVDIAGGGVVGAFAFYLFREESKRSPVVPNVRVGCFYLASALMVTTAALALPLWGVFLLWPAAMLGITAAGYFGLGPGIFRKQAGRLPWSTRFVLAPVLVAHYFSLVYYRRQCRPWDEVVPGVLLGRRLNEAEAARLVTSGVTAVLDLTAEFSETPSFLRTRYLNLLVLDLTAPTRAQLHQAAAFIAEELSRGTVYVHCKIGYSRSAAVVGAYLLLSGQVETALEAVAMLRQARPQIIVRGEALEALRGLEREAEEALLPCAL